jgi:hypothetical protein
MVIIRAFSNVVANKVHDAETHTFSTQSRALAEMAGVIKEDEHFLSSGSTDAREGALTPRSTDFRENGFVSSILNAYGRHRVLALSPDAVWLAIQVQFAQYVRANAEALRPLFVAHEGKKELRVLFGGSDDDLMRALRDPTVLAPRFVALLREHVLANVCDWTLPAFSTTRDGDRAVASLVLMAQQQEYFKYTSFSFCGIPHIELTGTLEDWRAIRTRARRLAEFEVAGGTTMRDWASVLDYVLAQFVCAVDCPEAVNVDFWQRICSHKPGGSGTPASYGGWMTAFCPFGKDDAFTLSEAAEHMRLNVEIAWPRILETRVPAGYARVPLTFEHNNKKIETALLAGHVFVGVSDDRTTLFPRADWIIVAKKTGAAPPSRPFCVGSTLDEVLRLTALAREAAQTRPAPGAFVYGDAACDGAILATLRASREREEALLLAARHNKTDDEKRRDIAYRLNMFAREAAQLMGGRALQCKLEIEVPTNTGVATLSCKLAVDTTGGAQTRWRTAQNASASAPGWQHTAAPPAPFGAPTQLFRAPQVVTLRDRDPISSIYVPSGTVAPRQNQYLAYAPGFEPRALPGSFGFGGAPQDVNNPEYMRAQGWESR